MYSVGHQGFQQVQWFELFGITSHGHSQFLGGGTSLDKFLKAYGASEEKGCFPYEWLDTVENSKSISYQIFFPSIVGLRK